MENLVVCIMGQDCEKFLPMCLKSVKEADKIIYVDGGSKDKTLDILKEDKFRVTEMKLEPIMVRDYDKIIISNEYNQEDLGMNGKQRNFYLNFLKRNYQDYWVLCLDADEVVEDLSKIKAFIQEAQKDLMYMVKMRHFEGTLGWEDNTVQEHFAPCRLFHMGNPGLLYPESEHPTLTSDTMSVAHLKCTTIWHLAYIPNLWDYKKKYENHLVKSEIHTKDFLKNWYMTHIFGEYPKKKVNWYEVPSIILKEFGMDPDEIYFGTHKTLEMRHYLMTNQWTNYFKPKNVLDLGCGIALFSVPFKMAKVDYTGIEISDWVQKNKRDVDIRQGDITKPIFDIGQHDLVLVLDVLEHLEEKDLDKALGYISQYGKNFMFSIPYLGDPNLDLDPTHKIKKSKEWWIKQLSKYFNVTDVPEGWVFKEQLLMGCPK